MKQTTKARIYATAATAASVGALVFSLAAGNKWG